MSSQRPHENRRETRRSLGYKMARQPGGEASPKRNSSLNLVTGFFHYLRGEWDALSAWLWRNTEREQGGKWRCEGECVCFAYDEGCVLWVCVWDSVGTAAWTVRACRTSVCVCAFCSAVFKCSLLGRFCIHFYKCFPGLWCILKANVLTFIGGGGGVSTLSECVFVCESCWALSLRQVKQAVVEERQHLSVCVSHSTVGRVSNCLISVLWLWPCGCEPVCLSVCSSLFQYTALSILSACSSECLTV